MGFYNMISHLFPKSLSNILISFVAKNNISPEEIRIKLGQPLVIRVARKEYICPDSLISQQDISHIIMTATNGAFHASIDHIQNGFIPLQNGGRLGICGEGAVMDQKIFSLRNINSLCLRIANANPGYADSVIDSCYNTGFKNTIIIGPPGAGKTTFLRECIRKLSKSGYYIGVADERGEISGVYQGRFSFDLGSRTDVISGINKKHAATMLLRTMAPDILAMDEITSTNDLPAIIDSIGCGVGLLATVHGNSVSDLKKPVFKGILDTQAFEIAIVVNIAENSRTYITERLYE